jgi:hypothetical protein
MMTNEESYWNKPLWQVKLVTETSHYDKWGELMKHVIMTSEASYWNNPWWQRKRVIETSHYDRCSELLKQAIMTSEASYLQTVSYLSINQTRTYTRYLSTIRWYFLLVFCTFHCPITICHDRVKNYMKAGLAST